MKTNSMVDHPAHYNRGSIEAIDVIEDWGLNFSLGSAIKYICRFTYSIITYEMSVDVIYTFEIINVYHIYP